MGATSEEPAELIQRAVAETQAVVEGELLDRVLLLDPTMFERLVLRLLTAMGYGESGTVEHSGKPGDGGIDGIISQDPLGLDRVYMQAKRYAHGRPPGDPGVCRGLARRAGRPRRLHLHQHVHGRSA